MVQKLCRIVLRVAEIAVTSVILPLVASDDSISSIYSTGHGAHSDSRQHL